LNSIRSMRGLEVFYQGLPQEVQDYYKHLPALLDNFDYNVGLSYVFSLLEKGQHLALYCSIVKLHRTNKVLTRNALEEHHFIRRSYQEMYKRILGKSIPADAQDLFNKASKVRDKLMHGKDVSDHELRNAIAQVLSYSDKINEHIYSIAAFRPYTPSLQGVFGRLGTLDKKASRWMLIGMGFFNNSGQES